MLNTNFVARQRSLLKKRQQQILEELDPSLRIIVSYNESHEESLALPFSETTANLSTIEQSSTIGRQVPPLVIYKYPPQTPFVNSWDLQTSVLNRLSILTLLNRVSEKNPFEDDLVCRQVLENLEKGGFIVRSTTAREPVEMAFDRDRLAHFFLRLAFSLDPQAREWFIQQEVKLLKIKLIMWKSHLLQNTEEGLSGRVQEKRKLQQLQPLLRLLRIEYSFLTYDPSFVNERTLWDRLLAAFPQQRLTAVVRVPWWPHLAYQLKRHRCYIQDGYGYIPVHEIDNIILGAYRRFLFHAMAHLQKQEDYIKTTVFTDPHIGLLVQTISETNFSQMNQPKISACHAQITADNIEEACFPPCMKYLYLNFKKFHHIRHWGRLQLWLFLKTCGMTLDSQLIWWRSLWHDPQKFDKEIKYNLRHAYGLEGKHVDYPAFSCSKILNNNPSPGNNEYHGCPFEHLSCESLRQFLSKHYPLTGRDLDAVLALKNSYQYQLACSELFKATHEGVCGDNVGNHPNAYFDECCKFRNSNSKKTIARSPHSIK